MLDKAQAQGDMQQVLASNQAQTQDEKNTEEQTETQKAEAAGGSNVINLDFSSLMPGAQPSQPPLVAPPQ